MDHVTVTKTNIGMALSVLLNNFVLVISTTSGLIEYLTSLLLLKCFHRIGRGSIFTNDGCEECFCQGENKHQCVKKECPECQAPFYYQLNHNCDCICKKCPRGEKLCSTSNMCLQDNLWCDGIDHCSDDELDCQSQSPTTTTKPETRYSFDGKPCPSPACSVGQKAIETEIETLNGCPYYKCLDADNASGCPPPSCPPNTIPKFNEKRAEKLVMNSYDNIIVDSDLNCPAYECVAVDDEEDSLTSNIKSCSYDGQQLVTFDGLSLRSSLCHHTLLEYVDGDLVIESK